MERTKEQLREQYKALLENIPLSMRDEYSREIVQKIFLMPEFHLARSIMVYDATPTEPQLQEMIAFALEDGKQVYYPAARELRIARITDLVQLLPSGLGFRQPAPSAYLEELPPLDLVILPGISFDKRGYRLGHGSGWYDRFWEKYQASYPWQPCQFIGVCFPEQLETELPVDKHDVPCSLLVTPGYLQG